MSPEQAEQSRSALQRANELRIQMAAHKRRIREQPAEDGFLAAAALLREPDEAAERLRVGALVDSIRHIGPSRANRLLTAAGLSRAARGLRVRQLSGHQRDTLARVFEHRGRR